MTEPGAPELAPTNNEPAFPTPNGMYFGMSLRDYFAAIAMQAIIAKTPFQEFPEDYSPYTKTALGAYDYADAMLRAKNT